MRFVKAFAVLVALAVLWELRHVILVVLFLAAVAVLVLVQRRRARNRRTAGRDRVPA